MQLLAAEASEERNPAIPLWCYGALWIDLWICVSLVCSLNIQINIVERGDLAFFRLVEFQKRLPGTYLHRSAQKGCRIGVNCPQLAVVARTAQHHTPAGGNLDPGAGFLVWFSQKSGTSHGPEDVLSSGSRKQFLMSCRLPEIVAGKGGEADQTNDLDSATGI